MATNKLALFGVSFGLILGFQNCSNNGMATQFTTQLNSTSSSAQNGSNGSSSSSDGSSPSKGGGGGGSCSSSGSDSGSGSGSSAGSGNSGGSGSVSDSSNEDLVVCILNGHGKSLKLGLDGEGQLVGVNDVSQAVCISEQACLNLVAPSFDVQGAYERGYCENNPNVTVLSDVQVQQLLGI